MCSSDLAHWRGLTDAVRMFAKRIGGSEAEVAADVGALWALCVALEAYADCQDAASSREIFVPLDADALRELRDLVAASGPWIRMFPPGCALDDQTRASGPLASEIVDAAAAFLRSAERTELLRDEDATILRTVLDAGGSARLADTAGNMPPEFRDYVGGYVGSMIGVAIGFVFMLFVGSIFSALGGLLGVALFRKPPQSNTIDLPTP